MHVFTVHTLTNTIEFVAMGLKIRAGMAIAGLAVSWFCGIPFLSGIAGYLDTTGNVMVDIADGIGLVSKVRRSLRA